MNSIRFFFCDDILQKLKNLNARLQFSVLKQKNLSQRFGTSVIYLPPSGCGCRSVVVDLLLIVAPIVCWVLCLVLVSLFTTLCPSGFAIILMEKIKLYALL